jgi:hypothetical protein
MAKREFEGEYTEPKLPFMFKAFRWIVFLMGDLRWLGWNKFPFCLGWYSYEEKIDLNEVLHDAVPLLKPGDVILHRDEGFISNIFIGGAMIHAGLYVGDGQVVEAISNGVVRRNAAHILYSDRAIILRPRVDDDAKVQAIEWGHRIVGFGYDFLFDFNGKREREMIRKHGIDARKMGVRFACTEVPYFCYFDYAQGMKINLRRNVNLLTKLISLIGLRPGKAVVDADMYVKSDMDVVWCSKKTTPEYCASMGCDETYVAKIKAWWESKWKDRS